MAMSNGNHQTCLRPIDYYKDWTAYDALKEAAMHSSWLSVWKLIECDCCRVPPCWTNLPLVEISPRLVRRIRWYNYVQPSEQGAVAASENLVALQTHFVGHHQRTELVLLCLQPSLDRIYTLLQPYTHHWNTLDYATAKIVADECRYTAKGWHSVAELMRGVARLPRIPYLHYVPRLAGVSGGNSPTMMPLTARTVQLESLLADLTDAQIASALLLDEESPVGIVAQAFIDCLDAVSRCWMDHVVTATTTIGITSGTKGTPNATLVDRVVYRLHHSRLLAVLGSLRPPLTGVGIEMRQLSDYANYPLASHYLDLFADPGPEFGTHNVGWLPCEYDAARADFATLRRTKRTEIWQHFYTETRPAFCRTLSGLLGIEGDSHVRYGLGSNVTDVLSRLVASLQMIGCEGLAVILPDDEFVTMQRSAAILRLGGGIVTRVPASKLAERVLQRVDTIDNETANHLEDGEKIRISTLVMFSLVSSCTQRVVRSLAWIHKLPQQVLVVLDVTQAVGNLPLHLGDLAILPNVLLVGSLVKHARCGEGLGFLSYSRDCVISQPASGWAAHISGLAANETVCRSNGNLIYDEELEWDGGTPSWIEAAYVATRIWRVLPSVEEQHSYVQKLIHLFLRRVPLSINQLAHISESNTLAIPVAHQIEQSLPFGLDYKLSSGVVYLRIGFGIQNLTTHLDGLGVMLLELDVLTE